MTKKPNVLMIIADQFRSDLLADSPLGQVAQLPRLRELMGQSVSFSKHYSVVVPCGPSRVSMLTSQYAMNHRAVRNGTPLKHDTPNLATAARAAGYRPQLFGYTDTTQDPRVLDADDPRMQSYEELMQGFDETVRMRMENDDTPWRKHLASKGIDLPPNPQTYRPVGDKITDPAIYSAEDSDTAYLTDQFLAHMDGEDQGWFAALTYIRPHPPLVAPAPYNAMYKPADMPAALRAKGEAHPFIAPAQDKQTPAKMVEGFPNLQASDAVTADLRAVYLGLASEVDHHVGRVIDWLKHSGQWDDTIVVFTSDHGEMLGDYGLWGKATFQDAAYHIPLLIRDPARPEMHGRQVDAMTESIDLSVTLLERIGADVPDSMNGHSLMAQLVDANAPARRCTVSEFDFGNPVTPTHWMQQLGLHSTQCSLSVLRTDRHRLIQFAADLPPILYDMQQDGEARDISNDPENMSILLDLTRQMLCHRMINPDPTFAHTIVGQDGAKTGTM